jgi:hypothetical protein
VKVTTPLASDGPLAAEITELPLPAASVTVFPLTGLLTESSNVTVIVLVVVPSATTDGGLALTVDVPGSAVHPPARFELLRNGVKLTFVLTGSPEPGPTGPGPFAAPHQLQVALTLPTS